MTSESGLETALPRFSLGRPVTVFVSVAALLVVGLAAAARIPLELIPRGFAAPFLLVQVPWRDAPPREVLDKIVVPLEAELSTVRGLDTVRATADTGAARCFLSFKADTDMATAYREVRDRVERARARFPADVEHVVIRKHDESSVPAYVIGLAVDAEQTDAYELIQNAIVQPLSRIEGVAAVQAQGAERREIAIELDRDRAAASGLNIYAVAQALARDNFALASGAVSLGERRVLLRSVARYADVEALRNRLLAPGVHLRDVAKVLYQEPERDYRTRANGRPAIGIIVFKEGQANSIAVTRRVDATLEQLRRDPRLRRIEIVPLFNQGKTILESLWTLVDSGRVGALLAVLVLLFFLRRLRLTLIVTLAIPLSLVIALTVMFFAGESLNVLTLLGLMISVGMLVDNSLVVAENIHRLHGEGMPAREAAIRGTGEIALAITMATLTTIIVFLPISLVEGKGQFFLRRLALPVSVSLLGSLFVAGIFVPLAVALTLAGARSGGAAPVSERVWARWLACAYGATCGRLSRWYCTWLTFFLRHRFDFVVLLATVLAATAVVGRKHLAVVPVQEEDRNSFEAHVTFPESTTLAQAETWFLSAEHLVAGLQAELGIAGQFLSYHATGGQLSGWFTSPRSSELTPREVTKRVVAALPEFPGLTVYTGTAADSDETDARSTYVAELWGEDPDSLESVARAVEDLFAHVDGVLGVVQAGSSQPNEAVLRLKRTILERQKVEPGLAAGTVAYALRGMPLPSFRAEGREVPVRIRFAEKDRETLADLADFTIPAGTGSSVALRELADVELRPAARSIHRRNKRMSRSVTVDLEEGREKRAIAELGHLVKAIELPMGVTWGGPRAGGDVSSDTKNMTFAGLLTIAFIYLLMGFLFESFVLPLSIVLTIPLAAIGVVFAHLATGRDIDILGVVGAILLVGIVVNNGIVLIDYVNRLRAEGRERQQAILLATARRFRPIMMTALTTVGGMIPLAVSGTTSIGMSYTSFSLTLIGGLTAATLLTLLVVPVFYTLIDDARERVTVGLRAALAPRLRAGGESARGRVGRPSQVCGSVGR
ncbi:MAG: efflux RND transporter permease subunit [Candidatus Schekmanbacteria bacterium]|nr:efflux RND transporter permease subunit [Candidatus Schekmanbacteria bacterium]